MKNFERVVLARSLGIANTRYSEIEQLRYIYIMSYTKMKAAHPRVPRFQVHHKVFYTYLLDVARKCALFLMLNGLLTQQQGENEVSHRLLPWCDS